MNKDFLSGFFWGNWFSSGEGNNSSGESGSGCGCLVLGIIGLIIFSFLIKLGIALIGKVAELLKYIEGIFEKTTDTILTKAIFFPSTYDLIFGVMADSYFLKAFLFIGTIIVLIFISYLVNNIFPNKFGIFIIVYLAFNSLILVIRTIYFIGLGVMIFFVGEEYNLNYVENDQIHFNVLENDHQLRYRYLISEEFPMPDANNVTHEGILWVEFLSENLNEDVTFDTHLLIKGINFNEVSQADLFTTTLSYIPIGPESTHTNLSHFEVAFIGDGDVLYETNISPDKPIEEISFEMPNINDLRVVISSSLIDESIIGLLDPLFIMEK